MKNDTLGMGTPIKNDELKELLKGTVATDTKQYDVTRTFGSIDMWNRHKKQRTSLEMRRRLN
jgi:hypothetical protein